MSARDGGPAFPTKWVNGVIIPGMTLRDYFAAAALQGYVSCPEWRADMNMDATARAAYRTADAMLAERDKK